MTLETFAYDHLIRDSRGVPLGRVILKDDSGYETGMASIPVVLLKIPLTITSVCGLLCYIDGLVYKIPTDIGVEKVNKRGGDHILTNFYLEREDHIKPLSSFDLTDRKQLLEAVNHTNLQPLWAEHNLEKGVKEDYEYEKRKQ